MKDGPYTLRYEQLSDGWCRAIVAEEPQVSAEAPTRDEAREMTLVALLGFLHVSADPTSLPTHPPVLAA